MSENGIIVSEGGTGELLPVDGKKPRADMRMIQAAVRKGWNISSKRKAALVSRLADIAAKTSVRVTVADGMVIDRPDIADNHAIRAAQVLVAMDAADQTDYWNADKNERIDAGKGTESVIQRKLPINLQTLSPQELVAFRAYVVKAMGGKQHDGVG